MATKAAWRSRIGATIEEPIVARSAEDDAEAVRDAASHVRHVHQKLGLSQIAFCHPHWPTR
jgi:hypothetical protein